MRNFINAYEWAERASWKLRISPFKLYDSLISQYLVGQSWHNNVLLSVMLMIWPWSGKQIWDLWISYIFTSEQSERAEIFAFLHLKNYFLPDLNILFQSHILSEQLMTLLMKFIPTRNLRQFIEYHYDRAEPNFFLLFCVGNIQFL